MGPTKRIVWPAVVSLSIPETWTHSEEDGVISLFDPFGAGVLQISFAIRTLPGHPSQDEALELLERFSRTQRWQVWRESMQRTSIADSPAAEAVYSDDAGTFWQVWQVVGIQRAMLVTYNCDAADAPIEAEHRLAIVSSLEWED
jgi:hypothetical protein